MDFQKFTQKSIEAIYNAETNPEGFIVYSKENDKKVWKNTPSKE